MLETTNMSFHARALRAAVPAVVVAVSATLALSWGFSAPVAPHTVARESDRIVLASPSGYQTVSMRDGGLTGLYYDAAEEALRLNAKACRGRDFCRIDSVVLLGLGGGEMLRGAHRAEPNAALIGVEIDAKTIELAADFGPPLPKSTFLRADAIEWIKATPDEPYSVVMVDLYQDSVLVPAATRSEFFADCARVLRPSGLFIMNVWPASRADDIERKLQPFFILSARKSYGSNVVLVGLRRP